MSLPEDPTHPTTDQNTTGTNSNWNQFFPFLPAQKHLVVSTCIKTQLQQANISSQAESSRKSPHNAFFSFALFLHNTRWLSTNHPPKPRDKETKKHTLEICWSPQGENMKAQKMWNASWNSTCNLILQCNCSANKISSSFYALKSCALCVLQVFLLACLFQTKTLSAQSAVHISFSSFYGSQYFLKFSHCSRCVDQLRRHNSQIFTFLVSCRKVCCSTKSGKMNKFLPWWQSPPPLLLCNSNVNL